MGATTKAAIVTMPEFFDRYITTVPEDNLLSALNHSLEEWLRFDWDILKKIGDKVYTPGKWTIKDLLQHINDNERIQSYRALCFARNDKTRLPGYDEDQYVIYAEAGKRSLEDLKEEFILLRKSAINMYLGFNDVQLQRVGICFDKEISVLALGFVLVGHQLHHLKIIRERYFRLAGA